MRNETIVVCISIFAMICIFMPFLSLMYQMARKWWKKRQPTAPPPPQFYRWYDNYGSGPKDTDDE